MPHRNITLSYNQWKIIHEDEKSVLRKEKRGGEGGFSLHPTTIKEWKEKMIKWKDIPQSVNYYTWSRGDMGGSPHVHKHKLSDYSQNILDMQYYRQKDWISYGDLHYPENGHTRNFAGWALNHIQDYPTNTQISYHTTNEQWDEMRFAMGKKMDLEQDKVWFNWDVTDLFREINKVRKIITYTTEQETICKTAL